MTNIVPERPYKGKNWPQAAILAALVVLVGIAAFGLGRLSAGQGAAGNLIIHQPGEAK